MNSSNNLVIPGAIIIAGALVAGAVIYNGGGGENTMPQAGGGNGHGQQDAEVSIKNVDTEGEPFIGSPEAPATIAYWLDFQCPFCKRFETQTLPRIIEEYVKDGQVKVVFKDFQFIGADSQTAGIAAGAIWELHPDHYFDWQEAMFERQDGENSGFGDREDVLAVAEAIEGIDADAVAQEMEANREQYAQEQQADRNEAQQFGISGTPGFVIGSQQISGAQPFSVFQQLIEQQLTGTN